MPLISTFYGIAIYMYYRDHAPPHFHAIYGSEEAVFDLTLMDIRLGKLPTRARKLVIEWATIHRNALLQDWDRAQTGEQLEPIEPLR